MSAGKRRAAGPSGRTPSRPATKRPTSKKPGSKPKSKPGKKPVKKGRNGKPLPLWRQRLMFGLKWATIVGVVLAIIGVAGIVVAYRATDIPDPNEAFETQTSFVYYAGGESEENVLGTFAVQNREPLNYDEMPQFMKDAVVAAENRTFWTDRGIDPKGIVRAFLNNASSDDTQGASTITQQYVKVLYLTQERSYVRKLKEAFLALKLQRQLSKEEILEGYLNTIYYGRGAYGVEAAAKAFFQVPAADLDLRQSAVLASVINNPTRFDPANGKENKRALRDRYRFVLDGMVETGAIDATEAEKAAKRLPKFPPQEVDDAFGGQEGHVLTMVKRELLRLTDEDGEPLFTEDQIDGGGLRVTTTFRKKEMQAAEEGVKEARPEGRQFNDKQLHVGVASVEPGTGAVRGIFAGQDFLTSQLNWAVAGGQAGSSLKAFAVAAGIRQGFELRDTFDGNSPIEIGDLDFENQGDSGGGDFGRVSLTTATAKSINTAFIDLTDGMDDGPAEIVKQMNRMGIPPAPRRNGSSRTPKVGFPNATPGLEPILSVALGSATVSPINMATGYATIANGGRYAPAYIIERVTDAEGTELYQHNVIEKPVMDEDPERSEDIAADVSYALQQVVASGSGVKAAGLGRPVAGKTGTATNDDGDVVSAWFTGYTPQLATSVVYVRGKGNGPLDGYLPQFFGSAFPLDTWLATMERAMDGVEVEDFPPPAFVTGEAPSTGFEPAPPPPPPPTKKPKPTKKPEPEPTQEPEPEPTQAPEPSPTGNPEPPPSQQPCGVLTPCPSPTPTSQPSPSSTGSPSPQPSQSPSGGGQGGGQGQGGARTATASPTPSPSRPAWPPVAWLMLGW